MAGTKDDVELPDISVLRQLRRTELSALLDSVSVMLLLCQFMLELRKGESLL